MQREIENKEAENYSGKFLKIYRRLLLNHKDIFQLLFGCL